MDRIGVTAEELDDRIDKVYADLGLANDRLTAVEVRGGRVEAMCYEIRGSIDGVQAVYNESYHDLNSEITELRNRLRGMYEIFEDWDRERLSDEEFRLQIMDLLRG